MTNNLLTLTSFNKMIKNFNLKENNLSVLATMNNLITTKKKEKKTNKPTTDFNNNSKNTINYKTVAAIPLILKMI